MNPLQPSAALLEKLAGIVHTALHELPGSATDRLCRDGEIVEWAQRMMALGLCPDPAHLAGSGR